MYHSQGGRLSVEQVEIAAILREQQCQPTKEDVLCFCKWTEKKTGQNPSDPEFELNPTQLVELYSEFISQRKLAVGRPN